MKHLFFAILIFLTNPFSAFSQLSVSVGPDSTFCFNMGMTEIFIGSNVTITGGTAPYQYSWSAEFTENGHTSFARHLLNDTGKLNPQLVESLPNGEWVSFGLRVRDANFNIASDTIRIRLSSFTLSPGEMGMQVEEGDSVLFSIPSTSGNGGIEPLTFITWEPAEDFNNPTSMSAWCKPSQTRTYGYVLQDSVGCILHQSRYFVQLSPITGNLERTRSKNCYVKNSTLHLTQNQEQKLISIHNLQGAILKTISSTDESIDLSNHLLKDQLNIIRVKTETEECILKSYSN